MICRKCGKRIVTKGVSYIGDACTCEVPEVLRE